MLSRYNRHLGLRYSYMGAYLGLLFPIMAAVMLFPLITLIPNPEDANLSLAFIVPALFLMGTGLFFRHAVKQHQYEPLDFNESSLVVVVTWIAISLAGAIPYMAISGLSFTHAMFDSVSGWTTTGLSLLDLSSAPVLILFYRAWTQLIGGAGIAIIMLASLTGTGSQQIYSAEGKGTLIKPNVLASARIVIILYLLYIAVGIGAYLLAGMSIIDAVVHCFAAISTGGFSNYPDSLGHFNSVVIESITILLMIFGNMSFLMGYFIIKGKIKSVLRNGEIRVMFSALLLAIPLLYWFVTNNIYNGTIHPLRIATFEAVSALTTTGFSLVSYNSPMWSDGGIFIMIILMLIGGGSCSTAGGVKQFRVYMLYKSILWQIKSSILPANAVHRNFTWEGDLKAYSNDDKIRPIANFVIMYLAFFAIGSMIITLSKNNITGNYYSLRESLFEFASSVGTVGLSVGVSSVQTPLHVTWLQTIGMLLGRLEFIVVFLAIIKAVKDTSHVIHK